MEVLTHNVIDALWENKLQVLGSGTYGEVALVNWLGKPAALKRAKSLQCKGSFDREAAVLWELNGKGGAPLVYGIAQNPPVMLLSYKGQQRLEDVLQQSSPDLVNVGLQIGYKLAEIHEAGYVHNDLKNDNIMVEGPLKNPKISIIDFGLACPIGDIMHLNGKPSEFPWYAPEVFQHQPSTFSSDVFTYGRVMQKILHAASVNLNLQKLHAQYPVLAKMLMSTTDLDPIRRPSLPDLLRHLHEYVKFISRNQPIPRTNLIPALAQRPEKRQRSRTTDPTQHNLIFKRRRYNPNKQHDGVNNEWKRPAYRHRCHAYNQTNRPPHMPSDRQWVPQNYHNHKAPHQHTYYNRR
ncbi:hypothetical protein OTU49_009829 [Cherax quadricarinatus]|uniref:Protein kinase domain-containing protein n=1 Tax=Cherax quadricarinatus TaxID=27406 RepID=A0AAW0W9S0_CHEQU